MDVSRRRSVVLSNYLAVILAISNLLLFLLVPQNFNLGGFVEMLIGMVIFLFPLVLNRLGFVTLNHLYLCWMPPVLITLFMISGMRESDFVQVTTYDGLRFYLLASGCIPYILHTVDRPGYFAAGVVPSLVLLVFCDPILTYLGVGIEQKGVVPDGYSFTPVRAFIAYLVINGSCFSLRTLVDRGDKKTERLLQEIEVKNALLQRQSQEKILESETRYRTLFDQASDAILMLDFSGRLIECNARLGEMLGYSKEELLKMRVHDLADKEQLKTRPFVFDKLEIGKVIYVERNLVRKDKGMVSVESSIQQLNKTEILAIVRDVSERKKMEAELREAETKFRIIVEKSLVGVYVMVEGKLVYVNPRFAEILGYEHHEFDEPLPAEMVVHFEDRALLRENIRLRLAGEADSIRYQLRGLRKDGGIVWLEAFGSVITYHGSRAIIGTLVDITERKLFEEQQALLASVISSSEDAIITQTLDGIVTSWNAGAEKLFGYSAQEMLHNNVVRIVPPDKLNEESIIMQAIRRGEYVAHIETNRLRRNGSLVFTSLTVSPIRNEQGVITGVSKIARDITQRKTAELERERITYALNERVKELTTLYRIGQLLQTVQKPLHEMLQEIAYILPSGWQYPDVSAARVVLEGMEFSTSNFIPGKVSQQASFITQQGMKGFIEVSYLEDKTAEEEGPFLKEERNLINMIAEMLQVSLSRRYETDALRRSEANQSSIINATNFFIWSVNREYELISFNKAIEQFMFDQYGISIKVGSRIGDQIASLEEIKDVWATWYSRALAGETYKIVGELSGIIFEYSLNPIIEGKQVIGVAVFAEDITERLLSEQAIQEANKQIGELRLMALRSVMNPHFIFNSLNSIQYYILENDQINAVNFLSTFSKLVRAILNNAVRPLVRLDEELDMLTLYVRLEAMRFDNKFSFVLDVNPEVDTKNTEIPSMLIQPFVENAILHGLYNKVDTGVLRIRVAEEEDMLIVEVEDDGVGRAAAARLKAANAIGHKSMGTTLTEERLRLINKEKASVETIDLERDGQPLGTKVRIRVRI